MRTLFFSIVLFISVQLSAQTNSTVTATLSVKGNCDECKARIENAADIKGVKLCVWDEKTQTATVTYKSDKVSLEQIQKSIAKSGHDAGEEKSSDKAYKKLPNCCQYRDRACEIKQ